MPSADGCSVSSPPPMRHPPFGKTTVTDTSGSPAGHCVIAPSAARATWFASKAERLASCRGLHLIPAMDTDRHQHQPLSALVFPMRPTRIDSCFAVFAPSQGRETPHYLPADPRILTVFARPALSDRPLPACDGHSPGIANDHAVHSMPIDASACGAV